MGYNYQRQMEDIPFARRAGHKDRYSKEKERESYDF